MPGRRDDDRRGGSSSRPSSSEQAPKASTAFVCSLLGSFSGAVPTALLVTMVSGDGIVINPLAVILGVGTTTSRWPVIAVAVSCVLILVLGIFLAYRRGGNTALLALLIPAAYSFVVVFGTLMFAPAPAFFLVGGIVVPAVVFVLSVPAPFSGPYGKSLQIVLSMGSVAVILVHVTVLFLILPLFVAGS